MVRPNEKIILGVSGGIDSICMLDLFLRLRDEFGLQLIIAHVNHNLRGKESDEDELFVKNLCADKNLILDVKNIFVRDFALANKFTLEQAGRICRYKFFYELQKKYSADKIATAHNKNDNAETILMKMIRGCGSNGFCGIEPHNKNKNLIRPLINIERCEIERYAAKNNLEYRNDSSNFDDEYTRNKIRNKIFPLLSEINSNWMETFLRSSEIISQESKYLDQMAIDFIENNHCEKSLPAEKLNSLHKVIAKRIIYIITKNMGMRDISLEHINSILDLANKLNGKKISLPHNFIAQKYLGQIIFFEANCQYKFEYQIEINKPIFIPQLGKFLCVSDGNFKIQNENACTKTFYYDNIIRITVRNYVASDKIYFKGFGHKKLKKIFADNKILPPDFFSIPLLAVNNDIVWIIGQKLNIISNNDCGKKYFVSVWEEHNLE